jgi:hypothetical protein
LPVGRFRRFKAARLLSAAEVMSDQSWRYKMIKLNIE